ncbi:MAG: hypothetical protein ACOX83_07510 [Candidatus Spyradocola sp.]|jgi:GMP synthase (glutamine-hydrolysing)
MMQRLVLVVNTGGSEGLAMVKGIRNAGVFCTMTDAARLEVPEEAKGVVVIGGPSEYARPCLRALLDRQLPILAFGDPAARLCEELGGQVTGHALTNQLRDVHFANLGVCKDVEGGMRMLQSAEYLSLPQGCRTLSVAEGVTLGFDDGEGRCTGFQFVPEAHDVEASEIIGNFLWNVLNLQPNYTFESYIDRAVTKIRETVGDGQAVCVLSGGVDSTVAACLAKRAVGNRLHCLVIEKGLGRKGELECIQQVLGGELGLEYRLIQAQGRVMEQLRNCVSPAQKRQAVEQFIADRISDEVARLGGHVVVVKGTNYTETMAGENSARLAGDIPVVEPMRLLFKDEVRQIAALLGVPEVVVKREHYPSAGIALRCMGAVDGEKLEALRRADEILRETLEEAGQNKPSSQTFAVLADFSSAFQDGIPRYVVILRAVNASGERHVHVRRLPQDVLERAAERIMQEVAHVYRVVYDLSAIPPAKIEWV